MRHVIPISGKDSLATAIIQKQREPQYDYEYIFNPTGKELPETIEWIKRVEFYLGKQIVFVGRDMKDTRQWQTGFRPSTLNRWCTDLCKIKPTEKYFKGEATVYYGLRVDEPERIGYENKGKSELTAKYPLRDVGFGLADVMKLCNDVGLKPPTFRWQLLVEEFTRRLGEDFLLSKFTEWQLDQLFAWRTRNNCYDCFNMKRYEWVGLHDHHPEIFWEAVANEEAIDKRDKHFYTIKDYPLRKLLENREQVLIRHIRGTVAVLSKLKQSNLFDVGDFFKDFLSQTSCGLLCGK